MEIARLNFITGKGGAGKSTAAAALALALARRGRCVLADLDGRRSAAGILDLTGPEFSAAADAAPVPRDPEPIALSPRAELEAFIHRIVPIKAISRRMLGSRTFGYVSAAAPGLEAFLILERLRIIAGDAALKNYHAIVDAPASGNALEMLGSAAGIRELAPLGTLNRLASGIEGLLIDPTRFAVFLTVIPETLAIREAIDTARRLRDQLCITRLCAILNCAVEPLFSSAELDSIRHLSGHLELARRRSELASRTAEARRKLHQAGLAVIELPMLFRTALYRRDAAILARALEPSLKSYEPGA
ncbi:MAG: ArsA-related P-loop ATPase [Candidatus Binataceae bacterium]